MKDLHLKFNCETGTSSAYEAVELSNGDIVQIPKEDYLFWIEDMALKYLKQDMSRFSKSQLEDELNRRKLREMNRQLAEERKSKSV
jgi:hypothetical protein